MDARLNPYGVLGLEEGFVYDVHSGRLDEVA